MATALAPAVGRTLLLKGYADSVLYKDSKNLWRSYPKGSLDGGWGEREIMPGEYTVCHVEERSGTVDLSRPGEEESRRQRARIAYIRSATLEEVQAAQRITD